MEYWLWLTQLKGVGPVLQKRLLAYFKSPRGVYDACEDALKMVGGVGPDLALAITKSRCLEGAKQVLDACDRTAIDLITWDDPRYPQTAKSHGQAPILLYLKGQLKPLDQAIGIVGARRCSDYGKMMTLEIATYLAQQKCQIISGLAKGIDGYAHIACLKQGAYPLAFVGHGLNHLYPKEHRALFAAVAEKGGLLSQFPPDTPAHGRNFPKRNALIAYFSQKLLVVEAGKNSGALITADLFKTLDRPLYALPHDLSRPTGVGCNGLIAGGARILIHPSQLLFKKEEGPSKSVAAAPLQAATGIEKDIYNLLAHGPKSAEEIERSMGIVMTDLLEILLTMEMDGIILVKEGGSYGQLMSNRLHLFHAKNE